MDMFDWISLPEGRARFSGGIRGWDEIGHETFAVEVDGQELFGEIVAIFLENNNNYNLEVVSFGYRKDNDVGLSMNACTPLTERQAQRIVSLVRELVAVVSKIDSPPSILHGAKKLFLGGLTFKDGWFRPVG
jgi:hypothetical protein